MQIHWTYAGCDPGDEREIERLWEDRQTAFEAKLSEVSAEPSELRLAIEHETEGDEWSLRAALHLPAGTLVAESTGASIEAAFDRVLRKLARKIDHMQSQPTEAVGRREGVQAVAGFLQEFRQQGRSDSFFDFLVPLVRSLRAHVRRELEILHMAETIPEEEITAADILDETMVRAWERFDGRPRSLSLNLWLTRLVGEVLADFSSGTLPESLEERRPVSALEPDDGSDADFWLEQEDDPEAVELGDLLEGHAGADEWDRSDIEVNQGGVAELLGKLPREKRQTLVLWAVEGFEPGEIADIQDRSVEEVTGDIASARQTLWHELFVEQDLPESERAIQRPGGRDRRRRR